MPTKCPAQSGDHQTVPPCPQLCFSSSDTPMTDRTDQPQPVQTITETSLLENNTSLAYNAGFLRLLVGSMRRVPPRPSHHSQRSEFWSNSMEAVETLGVLRMRWG